MRLAVLLLLAACSIEDEGPARLRQAIIGGTLAPDDEGVFKIQSTGGMCTASLIAPRTLLTAEHCLPQPDGHISASNEPGTETAEVLESMTVSQWSQGQKGADLALLFLDRAPSAKPVLWNWWAGGKHLRASVDRIRHVGYGDSEAGPGTRRQVTVEIAGVVQHPTLGAVVQSGTTEHGVCFGDSGGPAMLLPADGGTESVLGVHNVLSGFQCGSAYSGLVPAHRDFIEAWLVTHEDAGCARDGRCVSSGCAPADPDCVCLMDGVCNGECFDFDDPDCPADCGYNDVCSTLPCPGVDLDCVAHGERCQSAQQCPGRACIADPQHPNRYCSQLCSGGCPAGFTCDSARNVCIFVQLPVVADGAACVEGQNVCREGSACLSGVCTALCTSGLDCPVNHYCRTELPRLCVARNVVLAGPQVELPAADDPRGCSVGGGFAVWLAMCVFIRANRRR